MIKTLNTYNKEVWAECIDLCKHINRFMRTRYNGEKIYNYIDIGMLK